MPTSTEITPVHRHFGIKFRYGPGVHHFYYGYPLAVLGYVLMNHWAGFLCLALAAWMFCDDAAQHHRQVRDPYYRSPVHNLVHYLYKLGPWTRRLEAWANKLFGA